MVIAVGVFIGIFAITVLGMVASTVGFTYGKRQQVVLESGSSSLTVRHVFIEDALQGEEPMVWFSRTANTEFEGTWYVTIHTAAGETVEDCFGYGSAEYRPKKKLSQPVELFSWWMEREICDLDPGLYYAHTIWQVLDEEGREVLEVVEKDSNIFRIMSRDDE